MRICVGGESEIEDMVHVLFICQLYASARAQYRDYLRKPCIGTLRKDYFLQGINVFVYVCVYFIEHIGLHVKVMNLLKHILTHRF